MVLWCGACVVKCVRCCLAIAVDVELHRVRYDHLVVVVVVIDVVVLVVFMRSC